MYCYLLHQLLQNGYLNFPNKYAVVSEIAAITYKELESESSALAVTLKENMVSKSDRIALLMSKSIEAIIAIFGVLKVGATYVPLDVKATQEKNTSILSRCSVSVIIFNKTCLEDSLLSSFNCKYIYIEFSKKSATVVSAVCPGSNFEIKNSANDKFANEILNISDTAPAYILHTSGSTGSSKGVAISHANALSFINSVSEYFHITKDDNFCSQAPLNFDLSIFDIFVAIGQAATIFLMPEQNIIFPNCVFDYLAQNSISIWNSSSSALSVLANRRVTTNRVISSMRIVHFSGDVMPSKHLKTLKKIMKNAEFFNIYGQTEANSSFVYKVDELPEDDTWKIPIGRPLPNFEAFIVDDNNHVITSPGIEGELHISSSTLALGYWGDIDNTNGNFIIDPRFPLGNKTVYKTGDTAIIDTTGNFIFIGRNDSIIKSRGFKVSISEIELLLMSHPSISLAVVVPIKDDTIGNVIAAAIVPAESVIITQTDIISYCSKHLPKQMIPEIVEIRSTLPMTSSGKINRKEVLFSIKN